MVHIKISFFWVKFDRFKHGYKSFWEFELFVFLGIKSEINQVSFPN